MSIDGPDRAELRCGGCGYGAFARQLPVRCPICGGDRWMLLSGRRQTGLDIRPHGDAGAIITVADELDAHELAALSEVVAALVHDAPEIVVDLTGVRRFPRRGARQLLRLGAMTRGAGGNLRARCPTGATPATVVELDVERTPALARLDGPVGRAFDALRDNV